jgi:hypothetical protein
MKLSEFIKKVINDYFLIFASVMILLTILNGSPDYSFKIKDIYKIMICALVGDLPSFILYSSKELSEKKMKKRIIIHFIVLEAVVLFFVNALGWITGIIETSVLAFEIAFICLLIRFLGWRADKKVAISINEKLKELKESSEEADEKQ